jgi:hypothetical protein
MQNSSAEAMAKYVSQPAALAPHLLVGLMGQKMKIEAA